MGQNAYGGSKRGSLLTDARMGLSPSGRRAVRSVIDPVLRPVGSIRGAHTSDLVIALTFDDGPDPDHTPGVLDALACAGAQATFFLLVDRAEQRPDLVRRMIREGHEVGLHGADHRRLTTLPRSEVGPQLRTAQARLEELAAAKVRLFRPPFGSQSLGTYLAARRMGLDVVVWSRDVEDWVDQPAAQIATKAVSGATPGSILLLHDGLRGDPREPAPATSFDRSEVTALILEGLGERGYRPVTVGGLLENRKCHRTAWFRP